MDDCEFAAARRIIGKRRHCVVRLTHLAVGIVDDDLAGVCAEAADADNDLVDAIAVEIGELPRG